MLRRKLSSTLLRPALHPTPTRIPSVPLIPAQFSTIAHTSTKVTPSPSLTANATGVRGLASSRLLGSGNEKDEWSKKTVKVLKQVLAQRGLSQVGTKAILISRIQSSSPSPSRSASTSSKPKPTSTSAPTDAAPISVESAPSTPKVEISSPHPVNTTNLASHDHSPVDQPEPEALAPGLPEEKVSAVLEEKGEKILEAEETLGVEMPSFTPRGPDLATPPLDPHNFTSGEVTNPEPEVQDQTPKVMTVDPTSPATPEVRHNLHETVSSEEIPLSAEDSPSDNQGQPGGQGKSIPGLGDVLGSISVPSLASVGAIGSMIGTPKLGGGKAYEKNDRPLDGEEKTGVYVLAGIVLAGLLVGGGSTRRRGEKGEKDVKEEAEEAAKVAAHKG